MSTTLITNGTILTASERYDADVLIRDGVIAEIGRALDARADLVIDATGKLVMPGGIDVHTHIEMPYGDGFNGDDFYTGTVAAACGGTTTVVDYATQSLGGSLLQAYDEWRGRARDKAVIDYGFHMCVCDLNGDIRVADGAPVGRRRRDVVQAVHGLPRAPDAGRREHLQGHAVGEGLRRSHLHARGERGRHRRVDRPGSCARRRRRRAFTP